MSHEGIRISTQQEQAREGAEERPLSREAVIAKKVRVMISEGKGMEIDCSARSPAIPCSPTTSRM